MLKFIGLKNKYRQALKYATAGVLVFGVLSITADFNITVNLTSCFSYERAKCFQNH